MTRQVKKAAAAEKKKAAAEKKKAAAEKKRAAAGKKRKAAAGKKQKAAEKKQKAAEKKQKATEKKQKAARKKQAAAAKKKRAPGSPAPALKELDPRAQGLLRREIRATFDESMRNRFALGAVIVSFASDGALELRCNLAHDRYHTTHTIRDLFAFAREQGWPISGLLIRGMAHRHNVLADIVALDELAELSLLGVAGVGAERQVVKALCAREWPQLVTLSLFQNKIDDAALGQLCAAGDSFPRLASLNLANQFAWWKKVHGEEHAGVVLAKNKPGIGPDGVRALADSELGQRLTRLILGHNALGGEGLRVLGEAFPNLEILGINRMRFAAADLLDFCRSARFPSLQYLGLDETGLRKEQLAALLANPGLVTLERLDVSANPLGPAAMRAIPDDSPIRLTHLYLARSRARLGDSGVAALLNKPVVASLEHLDLFQNHVQEAGLDHIIASPAATTLREINLDSSTARPGGMRAIQLDALVGADHMCALEIVRILGGTYGEVPWATLAAIWRAPHFMCNPLWDDFKPRTGDCLALYRLRRDDPRAAQLRGLDIASAGGVPGELLEVVCLVLGEAEDDASFDALIGLFESGCRALDRFDRSPIEALVRSLHPAAAQRLHARLQGWLASDGFDELAYVQHAARILWRRGDGAVIDLLRELVGTLEERSVPAYIAAMITLADAGDSTGTELLVAYLAKSGCEYTAAHILTNCRPEIALACLADRVRRDTEQRPPTNLDYPAIYRVGLWAEFNPIDPGWISVALELASKPERHRQRDIWTLLGWVCDQAPEAVAALLAARDDIDFEALKILSRSAQPAILHELVAHFDKVDCLHLLAHRYELLGGEDQARLRERVAARIGEAAERGGMEVCLWLSFISRYLGKAVELHAVVEKACAVFSGRIDAAKGDYRMQLEHGVGYDHLCGLLDELTEQRT